MQNALRLPFWAPFGAPSARRRWDSAGDGPVQDQHDQTFGERRQRSRGVDGQWRQTPENEGTSAQPDRDDTGAVLRRVWVDDWQMQCCGEPFRVGQRVEFATTSEVDRNFLGVVLGEQRAAALTDYEDHHDVHEGSMAPLAGTVKTIEAISCQYEQQDRAMYPIAGTTQAIQQEEATGWEPEKEDVRFVGYVVTLEPG